jgi:hypothetical protein
MRIAYVIGARPYFVKMAPVISELLRRMPDGRHALIHTGQHYARLMSDVFLRGLGAPAPGHMLGVGSASHAAQTARGDAGHRAGCRKPSVRRSISAQAACDAAVGALLSRKRSAGSS